MAKEKAEVLSLAAIRDAKGRGGSEFIFHERARVFTLAESSAAAGRLLRSALDKGMPVKVTLDANKSLIHRVGEPKRGELEEFVRERTLLDKAEPSFVHEVSKITPVTFDIIDEARRWGAIKRCTRVVPSYAKAKEIFDFCANLSCSLPGPYAVSPCIPFQYVRDGCYARAHQMRRIIRNRYRYCCDKVFSFANQGSDRLAVKATKWGGCCVTWWYHVAPLISVRTVLHFPLSALRAFKPELGRPKQRLGKQALKLTVKLAYVIDPGMFDKPVLLSTWLGAQQDGCAANAHVSSHSIQPGSAYTPANYAGTSFTTDPSYTATETTLHNYASLTTC
jgi:hypothetical protein